MSLTSFLYAFVSIRGISIYFIQIYSRRLAPKKLSENSYIETKSSSFIIDHASKLAYCCSDLACDLKWLSNFKKMFYFFKIITTDISCVMGLFVTMFLYVPYMNTLKNINILIPTKFVRIQQTWHLKFIKKV